MFYLKVADIFAIFDGMLTAIGNEFLMGYTIKGEIEFMRKSMKYGHSITLENTLNLLSKRLNLGSSFHHLLTVHLIAQQFLTIVKEELESLIKTLKNFAQNHSLEI